MVPRGDLRYEVASYRLLGGACCSNSLDDVRILIVDDQPVSREAIREVLERRGHKVVAEAPDRDAAIAAAAHHKPDAALVDVRVGDESGFDIARGLTSSWPDLAVILTSVNLETSLETARAFGARAFVPKHRLHTVDLSAFCGADGLAAQPEP